MSEKRPEINLEALNRHLRAQAGGNTQEVLSSDWRLYQCAPARGDEWLVDWGPEQTMVRRLKSHASMNHDVWLISPAGNKYLPDSPDLPPELQTPKEVLQGALLEVFNAQRELELDLQVCCDRAITKWQAKYESATLPEVKINVMPVPCYGGVSRSLATTAKVTLHPPAAPYKQPNI